MKWLILAVQILSLSPFGFGQDVNELKFNQIGELLKIARSLDTKFKGLDARLTSMEDQLKNEVSPKQDRILQHLELLQEGQKQLENIPSEVCTQNQLETLTQLLATDECANGSHNCSENTVCQDMIVGFRCSCKDGYQGDGLICEDVDECTSGVHNCDINSHCQNQIGTYSCICRQGFLGDGFTCEDIDECTIGNHTCSSEAQCFNTMGDYECQCLSGFTGDGFTCDDIDECSRGVSPCNSEAHCMNNNGSFSCICKDDFTGDGISCEALPRCISPSRELQSLGCVTPVNDIGRSWDQAQAHCRTLEGRLLEGITSQAILNDIKENFKSFFTGNFVWVGFRNLQWTEGGGVISSSSPLFHSNEPTEGLEQCGSICATCDRPYIADLLCSNDRLALCQSLE